MRRVRGDRGAIAPMVAIMLIVVFGMAALTIDAGNLYWERRQLQNGADAAALALAAECAEGLTACAVATLDTPILGGEAQPYADQNSNDLRSEVPLSADHGTDPAACDPGSGAAANPLTDSTQYVKVTTETIDASNGNASFITNIFAPVFGQTGLNTTTVAACAVAAWGPLGGPVNIFPLAICEDPHYNTLTSSGTVFGPPVQQIWYGKDACNFTTQTYPGGFGWLSLNGGTVDPAAGTCSVTATQDQWWPGTTGSDTNTAAYSDCIKALQKKIIDGGGQALIHVPIFSDYCGPSTSPCGAGEHKLYIEGFAGFVISGYKFVGGGSHYTHPSTACSPPQAAPPVCIEGYFTEFVTYDGFINPAAGNFGATTVNLTN